MPDKAPQRFIDGPFSFGYLVEKSNVRNTQSILFLYDLGPRTDFDPPKSL